MKIYKFAILRGSRTEVFYNKGVLKNFAKLTGKHLGWSLFLIKSRPQVCKFINEDSSTGVLLCVLRIFFKNIYFVEHLQTSASVLFQ